MSEAFPRGRFVWYELNTTDPSAATDFYSKLIGWGTEAHAVGDEPYTMLTHGSGPFGGLATLSPEALDGGAVPHWLAYVATPDVDATAARTQALGGQVVTPPTDLPGAGRMAVLLDPQGAMFAVYKSAGEEQGGHDGPAELQEFSWHELVTSDETAAFEFYSQLFGWKVTEIMDMGELGPYRMFGRTELPLGGMCNKIPEMPVSSWVLYVRIEDVDAGAERVKALGGSIMLGPMEVPGGDRIVQCQDPQGAIFALHAVVQGDGG